MLLLQQLNYTRRTLPIGYWGITRDFAKCNEMLKTSKATQQEHKLLEI